MTDYPWYAEAPAEQLDRLVSAWAEAPTLDLESLSMLLEIAADATWAFAPESLDDNNEPVKRPLTAPARLVRAQLYQAKTMWDAARADSEGNEGGEGFIFTPRPSDKQWRSMIRPTEAVFDAG